HFYRAGDVLVFLLGGSLPLFSALVLARRFGESASEQAGGASAALGWRRNFLSFGTAWCQGFLEGGMLAFLSLYLLSLGLSADAAGGLMAVALVGVVAFQVPVSWLADRWGKMPALIGCYAVTAAALCLVPLYGPSFDLAVWLFL